MQVNEQRDKIATQPARERRRIKGMILAAGRGSRMSSAFPTTPKPLLKIGPLSLIEHRIENLKKAGITEVVINLHHLGKQIQAFLGNGSRYGISIEYSWEPDLLETGGGILKALPLLGTDPFLVVSADTLSDYPFEHLAQQPLSGLAHLVLVPNPPHHPEGDFGLAGNLVSFTATPRYNYGGFALLNPTLFAHQTLRPFKLIEVLTPAIQQSLVTGELYRGAWINVDTPERLAAAQQEFLQ